MSRHRKIRLSRSKAIVIAAAGALSVATAASAAATTSSQGTRGHAAGSDGSTEIAHEAAGAATQITWGLRYIRDTYGSPCAAWSHEQATGWY